MKEIGEKIKKAREERKITQLALAYKLDMSTATISKLENGHLTSVNTKILQLIGKELNLKFEI